MTSRVLSPMSYERPHRSGVLAVITAYAVLWAWGYALVPHIWGDGPFSLTCYLAPWLCPAPEPEPERQIQKVYHITYDPLAKVVAKKDCGCYWEVRLYNGLTDKINSIFCDEGAQIKFTEWPLTDSGKTVGYYRLVCSKIEGEKHAQDRAE